MGEQVLKESKEKEDYKSKKIELCHKIVESYKAAGGVGMRKMVEEYLQHSYEEYLKKIEEFKNKIEGGKLWNGATIFL